MTIIAVSAVSGCDWSSERLKEEVQHWKQQAQQLEEEREKWLSLLDAENAQLKSLFEDARSAKEQLIEVVLPRCSRCCCDHGPHLIVEGRGLL